MKLLQSHQYRGNISAIAGNHEEADTRLILHAQDGVERSQYKRLIFICRDTNVLLLLMFNFGKQDLEVWWLVEQTRKWNVTLYIPWSTQNLPEELLLNIIGFHALTGRDTVSSFSGLYQERRHVGKYSVNIQNYWMVLGAMVAWKMQRNLFVCRLCKSEVSIVVLTKQRLHS